MMRYVVLDTETTGLNAQTGDRIIEIGCVELIDRRLTGNNFHHYVNPERDSEKGALAVHGLTTEFLRDKPKFSEIALQMCTYLSGAHLIIHNAAFDIGFLNAEFKRLKLPELNQYITGVTDTLVQAKMLHPGRRNSLDALCDRYGISNHHRTFHGALLDSALLAEVYLAMTRGQNSLVMEITSTETGVGFNTEKLNASMPDTLVCVASSEEMARHEQGLFDIEKESKGQCMWLPH